MEIYRTEVVKRDYNYFTYNIIIVIIKLHRNGRESCARGRSESIFIAALKKIKFVDII